MLYFKKCLAFLLQNRYLSLHKGTFYKTAKKLRELHSSSVAGCSTHSLRLSENVLTVREAEMIIPKRIASNRLSSSMISDLYILSPHGSRGKGSTETDLCICCIVILAQNDETIGQLLSETHPIYESVWIINRHHTMNDLRHKNSL